jgi:glycosyltransferase involved in cell wall biosynthesis
MQLPGLNEIPAPLQGKTGWPWTDAPEPLPELMPDGSPWPKISVVTPSYNQGQFIEETIRSVLLQGYPNLEYIVMDGGSTDGSVEIIKKYEPWLTYWVSEADAGQSAAINKGFKLGTGEILAWLNSDDFYSPNMLTRAALFFSNHSDVGMIFGDRNVVDEYSILVEFQKYFLFFRWQLRYMSGIPQETAFFRTDIFKKVGQLDEQLQYAMDFDLWWRVSRVAKIQHIPNLIGNYRNHEFTKGNITNVMIDSPFRREINRVRKKYMHRSLCPGEAIILRKAHSLIRKINYFIEKRKPT